MDHPEQASPARRSGSERRFAGILARHRDQVVLVREEYPSWGGVYWNIPSGRIEDDESPAEGASRELSEETGLVVSPEALDLQGTTVVTSRGSMSRAWNFTATIEDPALRVDDPDGLIQEARWFAISKATRLLRELPYRPLSEPAVAILEGITPGAHWTYPDPEAPPMVSR